MLSMAEFCLPPVSVLRDLEPPLTELAGPTAASGALLASAWVASDAPAGRFVRLERLLRPPLDTGAARETSRRARQGIPLQTEPGEHRPRGAQFRSTRAPRHGRCE